MTFALHYQHASPQVWYDINSTRELTSVHSGQSPASAADPFEPEAIPLYVASILLLWPAGPATAGRPAGPRDVGQLHGVYLSHIVFLDALVTLGLGRLSAHLPWIWTVLIAVTVTWIAATLFTGIVARTPAGRWLVRGSCRLTVRSRTTASCLTSLPRLSDLQSTSGWRSRGSSDRVGRLIG